MNEKLLKNLVVRLLDDAEGISADAYTALVSILPDEMAKVVSKGVQHRRGRVYLPVKHRLQSWKEKVVPNPLLQRNL